MLLLKQQDQPFIIQPDDIGLCATFTAALHSMERLCDVCLFLSVLYPRITSIKTRTEIQFLTRRDFSRVAIYMGSVFPFLYLLFETFDTFRRKHSNNSDACLLFLFLCDLVDFTDMCVYAALQTLMSARRSTEDVSRRALTHPALITASAAKASACTLTAAPVLVRSEQKHPTVFRLLLTVFLWVFANISQVTEK